MSLMIIPSSHRGTNSDTHYARRSSELALTFHLDIRGRARPHLVACFSKSITEGPENFHSSAIHYGSHMVANDHSHKAIRSTSPPRSITVDPDEAVKGILLKTQPFQQKWQALGGTWIFQMSFHGEGGWQGGGGGKLSGRPLAQTSALPSNHS